MTKPLLILGLLPILKLSPELHLTEVRRISLPDGVQLSRAILTPENQVLVVDNRRHVVWISTDSEWEAIGLPFGFTPVGAKAGEARVELIDAMGAVASIDLRPSITRSWELDPPPWSAVVEKITTAVAIDDGWVGVGSCRRRNSDS